MLHVHELHPRSVLWGESPGDSGTKLGAGYGAPDPALMWPMVWEAATKLWDQNKS